MADIPTLKLNHFLGRDEVVHVARAVVDDRYPRDPHRHDFYEVFWVTNGVAWHTINGTRHRLSPNTIWFIRKQDVHTFHASGRQSASFINVACPGASIESLRRKYARDDAWPWDAKHAARAVPIAPELTRRLTRAATDLATRRTSAAARDRFLLTVLCDVPLQLEEPSRTSQDAGDHAGHAAMPVWLQCAVKRLQDDPEALRTGVSALADHSHRCREHVARTLRDTAGITPTQLINTMRLRHAAHALSMTDRAITDIAADVGLENLSHFYRLFKHRFGTTPRKYRARQRSVLGGRP